jgi:predicted O-methyltransferase YrrM
MNKFSKLIKAVGLILQRPALLNLILKDEQVLQQAFEKEFPHLELQQTDVFGWPEAAQLTIAPYAFLSGSSMATDFALLQLLCRRYSVETYLEIGTWRGESAANVAPYVKEVFTLNLPDQTLLDMGMSQAYIASHRFFSKDLANVSHLFGDSATFDWTPYKQKCDLIFIDGDHSTEAVERDTRTALGLRKSEKSILVWHDAKSDGEYPRYEVLLGIYRALPAAMHDKLYLVKHALCAVYLPDGADAAQIQLNALPNRQFEIGLKNINL